MSLAGTYPDGLKCKHRGKPAEPYAREGQHGHIIRITPAARGIPAQAFVQWEDFTTWEKLSELMI